MRYVGLDVHSRQSTFCVLDEGGRTVATRAVRGSLKSIVAEVAQVKAPFAITYEASTAYGLLYDELSKHAQRVVVAHPGELRLIFRSKRKNDRVDAQKLAKMLLLDMVPPVHVPSRDVRAWRRMIEHRQRLIEERTRAKNALRALLHGLGIESPKGLWTKRGLAWLRNQPFAEPLDAIARDDYVERIEGLSRMAKRVEKALDAIGREHPGVRLLMTIPGVGIRTAEAVVAYIDVARRFSRNKAVGSYFGLVPCQDASASKNRLGHITQQGPPTVRRLLNQAAWQGIRRSATIRAYYDRMRRDDPDRKKIAVVATMHYLVRVMHAMLVSGEAWRSSAA